MNFFSRNTVTQKDVASSQKVFVTVWDTPKSRKREIRFNFIGIPDSEKESVWTEIQTLLLAKYGIVIPSINDHSQAVIVVPFDTHLSLRKELRSEPWKLRWNDYSKGS